MRGHGQWSELQSKLQQWLLTCGHVQLLAWRVDWSTYMQWCVVQVQVQVQVQSSSPSLTFIIAMLALSNIAAYAYSTNLSVCVAILIGLSNRCSKSMQHCTDVCAKWSCQQCMCGHGQRFELQSDV